jgi:hypothetical protein
MKVLAAALFALALSACAGAASPDGGVATYDALKSAQTNCAAKGGSLRLRSGGDPEYIGDYACRKD